MGSALRNWDADRADAVVERDTDVNELNRQCFQRAIAQDSTAAPAPSGLADCYRLLGAP